MSTRIQRALDKAQRYLSRLSALQSAITTLDGGAHDEALVELEALVLSPRGSSETDHRQQLTLSGLQAAFELYLAPAAPHASAYAKSADPDGLLSDEALRELRAEYPDEAASFDPAEVAAAVRGWAQRFAQAP